MTIHMICKFFKAKDDIRLGIVKISNYNYLTLVAGNAIYRVHK